MTGTDMCFDFPPSIRPVLVSVFAASCLLPISAWADDDSGWFASVEAGAEYSSNLNVDEIDVDSGSDDYGALIEGSVGYDHEFSGGQRLLASYDFSQSLYAENSDFDLQSHIGTVSGEFEAADFILTTTYSYIDVYLGGDAFLDMHLIRQSVARLVGASFYVDANYTFMDKSFDDLSERDADTSSVGIDTYYFFNNAKSYVVFGLEYQDENADNVLFDYDGYVAHVDVKVPTPIFGADSTAKLGVKYTDRDYDAFRDDLGAARQDEYYQFSASLTAPITDALSAVADYEYADRQSNLPAADYVENIVSLGLKYDF